MRIWRQRGRTIDVRPPEIRLDPCPQFTFGARPPLKPRTYSRVVEPLPQTRQGLGKTQLRRSRILDTRIHSPHAAKVLKSLLKSPDGPRSVRGGSVWTLTIVHRGSEFLVAGFTNVYEGRYDRCLFDCDINFLAGKGVTLKWRAKSKPIRRKFTPVKLRGLVGRQTAERVSITVTGARLRANGRCNLAMRAKLLYARSRRNHLSRRKRR